MSWAATSGGTPSSRPCRPCRTSTGSVRSKGCAARSRVTETYRSLADRMQQQTGVPYLLFDGSLSAIPGVYARVGERGRELGRYAERLLAEIDRRVARVPAGQRPAVYYARGPKGLDTAARGSINVESLERLGARNVADKLGGGVAASSPEQVLAWDPEIIVAIDPAFVASVRTDPVWKSVRAVREGRVYLVPQAPFRWVDFPPSVSRKSSSSPAAASRSCSRRTTRITRSCARTAWRCSTRAAWRGSVRPTR